MRRNVANSRRGTVGSKKRGSSVKKLIGNRGVRTHVSREQQHLMLGVIADGLTCTDEVEQEMMMLDQVLMDEQIEHQSQLIGPGREQESL